MEISQRSLKCHVGEVAGGWSILNVDYDNHRGVAEGLRLDAS